MLFLAGHYDFFVASKLDLEFKSDIKVVKKTISFTPIYTVPQGWMYETKDMLLKISNSTLAEGKLERKMEDWLPWEDIHFRIYDIMKNDILLPYKTIADQVENTEYIVRKCFLKTILPYCDISHYFFPKGYSNYQKSFIIAKSDYEKGILEAFSKLPCTTYIFPLEEEIALTIFHEDISNLMFTIRKLEEKGYLEKYYLHVPLHWE